MMTDYRRDDAAHILVIALAGSVTRSVVRALLDRQAETCAWSYGVVYDEREAHANLSSDDMRRLAARASELSQMHGRRGPVAIVAAADVDYGVNRMVSAYADMAGYEIAVYRTLELAVAWVTPQSASGQSV